jgi:hypothetical protein
MTHLMNQEKIRGIKLLRNKVNIRGNKKTANGEILIGIRQQLTNGTNNNDQLNSIKLSIQNYGFNGLNRFLIIFAYLRDWFLIENIRFWRLKEKILS